MADTKFEFIPQKHDELIRLAKYIAAFKTPEMEVTFAKLMQKHMNPMVIVKGSE